tara:strand:+ start:773 stop:1048 length:276 start_codon:yes stop_codon:yes gene_type:complete
MLDVIQTKQSQARNLSAKLRSSLLLESMFNIDWGKGQFTRYSQTKYIDGSQQTYKSWLQQGDEKIVLTYEQYEKLSGIKLNSKQIKNWRAN